MALKECIIKETDYVSSLDSDVVYPNFEQRYISFALSEIVNFQLRKNLIIQLNKNLLNVRLFLIQSIHLLVMMLVIKVFSSWCFTV